MFFGLSFFILFLYYPLFCPMFSGDVRVEYLSASWISFQTLNIWVHFVWCSQTPTKENPSKAALRKINFILVFQYRVLHYLVLYF
jgi:hypothetical protein